MLSVVFGKTSPVYHPDEVLTGDVVLNTTTPSTILDLTVNFCGISAVSLVVSKGKESSQNCEKIEESDIHLDVLDHLVYSYRGVDVESGVSTYPFSLWLPPHLPSSHISAFGNINYYILVHLQTSTFVLDFRKPFYIVAPVNINVFYAFQSPRSAEVTKKYGLFNKTVRLKAAVSSTCFVPGDLVSVVVEVSNESSKPLQYLFCTLKQVTTVVVQLRDKVVNRVTKQCLKTEAQQVTRSSKRHTWVCQMATSPSLTPTIANSSLILVTYAIQVAGKLAQVAIPPEVEIPIVFGVRAPVRPQHTVPNLHTDTNRTRRISQLSQSTSCSPEDSNVPVVPRRRRRYSSQPPLRPPTPSRRISHQIHNVASQRISTVLQPSFEDAEKPELFQSEQKEPTNCSPVDISIPVDAGRRRHHSSQPPLRPPTPSRRTSHQIHNVASQRISTVLQPSFEDAEKPELFQSEQKEPTNCSPVDISIPVDPGRRRHDSSQPPLRPPTPSRRISHQIHNVASQRISTVLQPSFEDAEKPELFQSEQKEPTNCSPIDISIPVDPGRRRHHSSQPPLRPPTPSRRISHQIHNVASQRISTVLQPSFEDAEKPELFQSEQKEPTNCSPVDISIPVDPGRRRHHSSQPPLRPPTPLWLISHQIHNVASQRISTVLQPSFEDAEKPELFQSEQKEPTNCSPIDISIPVDPGRRRHHSSQPPLRPPTPLRRISHQIHNVASQRISTVLQPSFEDAEKPELFQSEQKEPTNCSPVDISIPVDPGRRRHHSSQPPLRPPTPSRRMSHQIHNVASQRISIILQPSFEDAEKPELFQSEV